MEVSQENNKKSNIKTSTKKTFNKETTPSDSGIKKSHNNKSKSITVLEIPTLLCF